MPQRLLSSFPMALLVLVLAGLTALSAASQAALLTEADVAASAGTELLYLPQDRLDAVALIHSYNATTRFEGAERRIPSLADLRTGKLDWPLPPSDGEQAYADADASIIATLAFDLRQAPHLSDRLVLPVPARLDLAAMQGWLDDHWQGRRHQGGLRPAALEKEREISLGGAISTIAGESGFAGMHVGNYLMLGVAILLLYLGIIRGFEPLLLVPIAMGCIFVNAIGADMVRSPDDSFAGGILYFFNDYGIQTGIFPILIFLGVGALTDFGPLLANPWSALLGGAAQFGIFGAFFLAVIIGGPLVGFTLQDAGAIAIIGGADGPTSIFVASKLAPDKLGAIAVAAYSYMALVPIIQPPIMRALTKPEERTIMMTQRREVSQRAKIAFPIIVILLCVLTLPSAVPLIGMLMFGNLLRECQVTDRLCKAAQNELINLVTIALGLAVGTKLSADKFLNTETLLILILGCIAFIIGTATGVLFGRLMSRLTDGKINPLIGAAGVSAVPMAARVVHGEGLKASPRNMLLMHAMGPNVAGVIGSAVAAGILLALLG